MLNDLRLALRTLPTELLSQESDVGKLGSEAAHDGHLGLVARLGDGSLVRLPHHADVGAEVPGRDRARRARRIQRALEKPVAHARGSPRTRSPMMFRWISDVPPAMAKRRAKRDWNAQRPLPGARGVSRQSCP